MSKPQAQPRPRRASTKADVVAGFDVSLALQLWALTDAFERRLAIELQPMGLTVAGFRLIGELVQVPQGLRIGALAERLSVKAPSVSAMVDRFEANGLVERVPDPDDARAALVRLAPNAPLAGGLEVLARMERDVVKGLERAGRDALSAQLQAATERLRR